MLNLSIAKTIKVKKVHCPICGGRICDTKISEQIIINKSTFYHPEIIVKCYKCGNKISISIR